jgi:hypothetical protein
MRANHEFLIENSPKYLSFYESKLGQVERSEEGGITNIRLFDPNDSFKCLLETIETIWPILKPEFNKKVKLSRIEISPSPTPNKMEFRFDLSPNALSVKFSPERIHEIHKVVDEALDFYEIFLANDLFSIQIRNQTNFSWSPYSDGDIHIIKDLTNLVKSCFLKNISDQELRDPIYWVREILLEIKNSKKYVPSDLIQKTREKYIELDFIMSSLD